MLSAAVRTHAGRVRPHNEDASVCRPEQGLFAVIDGMGGEAAGEVAAAMAAAAIAEVPNTRRLAGETVLSQALRTARDRILTEAERNPACRSMGAVATALRFEDRGDAVAIAHVGDTRVWRVNARGVTRLTEDHVADAPEPGRSKPAVTRDLGRRDLDGDWVTTRRVAVARGDLLVMASDGLHDPVSDEELAAELLSLWKSNADPDAVCARLVALALARGGPDNVTVVAVRVARFRRGGGTGLRRLDWPASMVVLVILLGLTWFAASWRAKGGGAVLPADVRRDTVLYQHADYTLAGPRTTVPDGRSLSLRGVRVTGAEWAVHLGTGSELVVDRTVVELSGPLVVVLGEGASVRMTDTRITAARLQADGVGRMTLSHVALPATSMYDERIELVEDDVRTPGAAGLPGGASPPAAPPGTPPVDDAPPTDTPPPAAPPAPSP